MMFLIIIISIIILTIWIRYKYIKNKDNLFIEPIVDNVDPYMVMNFKQLKTAMEYYNKHKRHIHSIVADEYNKYPPSLLEDKNDPRLWKEPHWNWFLSNYNDLK